MGLFDAIFGGSKKTIANKIRTVDPLEETEIPQVIAELSPEVIAAISASVNMMSSDESDAAVVAAVTAAIMHARKGGAMAVEIKRSSNIWYTTGRQKIMDARL